MNEEVVYTKEEEEFAKLFTHNPVENPIENTIEYIGGSFEVLFLSGAKVKGYTKWIPLDTAERIASTMNGGNNIVQVASVLRDYSTPLQFKLATYEISNREGYKHQSKVSAIHEWFDYFEFKEDKHQR